MAKLQTSEVSSWAGQTSKHMDAAPISKERTMQRIVISAVLLAGFAGSALAESPLAVPEAPFVSTKTRAEGQADLAAYQSAGVNPWSISYNPVRNFRSTTAREAVAADYVLSRDQVHAMNSEDSGSQWLRTAANTTPALRFLAAR